MDIIKKIKALLPEVITKLKAEDKDGAVESLEKLAEEVEAAETTDETESQTEEKPEAEKSSEENKETETEAEKPAEETNVEKMISAKVEAEVKKYVEMFVNAENVTALKEQISALIEDNKNLQEKVEKLENASRGSQQLEPVSKSSSVWDD